MLDVGAANLCAPDVFIPSLSDGEESLIGSNPLSFDSDGDGLTDSYEVNTSGTDPSTTTTVTTGPLPLTGDMNDDTLGVSDLLLLEKAITNQ